MRLVKKAHELFIKLVKEDVPFQCEIKLKFSKLSISVSAAVAFCAVGNFILGSNYVFILIQVSCCLFIGSYKVGLS